MIDSEVFRYYWAKPSNNNKRTLSDIFGQCQSNAYAILLKNNSNNNNNNNNKINEKYLYQPNQLTYVS